MGPSDRQPENSRKIRFDVISNGTSLQIVEQESGDEGKLSKNVSQQEYKGVKDEDKRAS